MGTGRIAVGFDGSDCSWHAAEYAAVEARSAGLALRLVHAILQPEEYAAMAIARPGMDATIQASQLVDLAETHLRNRYPGLRIQSACVARSPESLLVAEARSAAMVVVGRRGRRGIIGRLAAWHLGSVSQHVAARASCPVVVVGDTSRRPGGPVVLGVDATDPSPAAITFAFEAAARRHTELRAEYVWKHSDAWPSGPTTATISDFRTDQAQARRMLGEALAGWRPAYPDVPVVMDVLHGLEPGVRLLDVATHAALLVIGSSRTVSGQRSGGGLRLLAGGPVGDDLVRNAPCPVAVVHAAPSRDGSVHAQV